MKKKTALLVLALFAGTTGFSMADPYFAAKVRVAPGINVGFGNSPVAAADRRAPLPLAVADHCKPSPVVVRPVYDRRIALLNRWQWNHRHRSDRRFDRDGDRSRRDFDRSYGDRDRRD